MAVLHQVILLILPLFLFLAAVDARQGLLHPHDHGDNNNDHNPFGLPDFPNDPFDLFKPKDSLPDDDDPFHKNPFLNPLFDDGKDSNQDELAKPDFETASLGTWELVNGDAGVSAMHTQLMPNNKIMLYDTIVYRVSRIKARPGECIKYLDPQNVTQQDCWAHVVQYDIETNQVARPIKV